MPQPPLKQLLTVFGRQPVLEALNDHSLKLYRLHLADSNKPGTVIENIRAAAAKRDVEILVHSKKELSRISKNSRQDQGVALDIFMPNFLTLDFALSEPAETVQTVIAVDSITNPQNLGMIIRSVCATKTKALIIPEKGCARLDALVIKASAGTLFRCPIIRCPDLVGALQELKARNRDIILLEANAPSSLFNHHLNKAPVFIIGNETHGISENVKKIATQSLSIPMENGVESLNAAVTASLVAFFTQMKD